MPTGAASVLLANLNQVLIRRKVSRAQLARQCGVQQTTLNRIFNAEAVPYSPSLDVLQSLASGLGVTVSELLSPDLSLPEQSEPSYPLGRQVGRLLEDFLACGSVRRNDISRYASQQAEAEASKKKDEL